MKVILFNGSMNEQGNTYYALHEIEKILNNEGIETELLCIGNKPIRDCIACGGCVGKGRCVFNDDIANEWLGKMEKADGFIFGTPVYFAHASGRLQSIMDRMFYANKKVFAHKVGAVVSIARRAGTTFAVDNLNKYLLMSNVIIPGSTYWNVVFGRTPGESQGDAEGMQTMRNLAKNMAWVMKCLEVGKYSNLLPPDLEYDAKTHFIR